MHNIYTTKQHEISFTYKHTSGIPPPPTLSCETSSKQLHHHHHHHRYYYVRPPPWKKEARKRVVDSSQQRKMIHTHHIHMTLPPSPSFTIDLMNTNTRTIVRNNTNTRSIHHQDVMGRNEFDSAPNYQIDDHYDDDHSFIGKLSYNSTKIF